MDRASGRQGLFGLLMGSAARLKTLVKPRCCAFYSASSDPSRKSPRWSKKENEKLKELTRNGAIISRIENLEAEFPGRTYYNIVIHSYKCNRASVEGSRLSRNFSPEEDRLLIEARLAGKSWTHIQGLFPNRNLGSIRLRWEHHSPRGAEKSEKIIRGRWSSEVVTELFRLRSDLGLSWSEIATRLGRSIPSVKSRFYYHVPPEKRPTRPRNVRRWTQEDLKTLATLKEAGKSSEEIGKVLGRSEGAIKRKVSIPKSGTGPPIWTYDEISRLRAAFEKDIPLKQIESMFPNRTKRAIRSALIARGLFFRLKGLEWTEEEDTMVTAGLPMDEMVTRLPGKTPAAIELRARQLAIQDPSRHRSSNYDWTPADYAIVDAAIRKGFRLSQVLPLFPGRSIRSIRSIVEQRSLMERRTREQALQTS